MIKKTTKQCKCGNTNLGLLTSQNKKFCTDCELWIEWYLEEGQASVYTGKVPDDYKIVDNGDNKG